MKKSTLFKLFSYWPPFLGAGIKVDKASDDLRYIKVSMKLNFWNRNYVGTHYGGSIYSMVDPFYMLMIMQNLGRDFIVWDKAASIRFKKPGKGKIWAEFNLTSEVLDSLKSQLKDHEKIEPDFVVEIKDEVGDVVAMITKTIYIKNKKFSEQSKQ